MKLHTRLTLFVVSNVVLEDDKVYCTCGWGINADWLKYNGPVFKSMVKQIHKENCPHEYKTKT